MGLTNSQHNAYNKITTWFKNGVKNIVLTGSAGTGKTYLLDQIIEWANENSFRNCIRITAPTQKALRVLKSKINNDNGRFSTIHVALRLRRTVTPKGIEFISTKDTLSSLRYTKLLVIDECSMVPSNILKLIEDNYNGIVLYVGDKKQLNPINEAESKVFSMGYDTVELTEIVRQGENNPIIQLSSKLSLLNTKKSVITPDKKGYVFTNATDKLIDKLAAVNGTDELKYLAYRNAVVNHINDRVRVKLYGRNNNMIEDGESLIMNARYKSYSTSDEIRVTSLETKDIRYIIPTCDTQIIEDEYGQLLVNNDKYLSLYLKSYVINGDINVPHEEVLPLLMTQRKLVEHDIKTRKQPYRNLIFLEDQFAKVAYNHAITVHKSQGSTFKRTIIDKRDLMLNHDRKERRRLLYTAITRASDYIIFTNV